jgi:hypothetical protein
MYGVVQQVTAMLFEESDASCKQPDCGTCYTRSWPAHKDALAIVAQSLLTHLLTGSLQSSQRQLRCLLGQDGKYLGIVHPSACCTLHQTSPRARRAGHIARGSYVAHHEPAQHSVHVSRQRFDLRSYSRRAVLPLAPQVVIHLHACIEVHDVEVAHSYAPRVITMYAVKQMMRGIIMTPWLQSCLKIDGDVTKKSLVSTLWPCCLQRYCGTCSGMTPATSSTGSVRVPAR